MGDLVPQTIEWIDKAPVSVGAQGIAAASPEAVFAVLADHERWTEWFPRVREVTVLGPAEGVGARRRVRVPGLTVDEEFIVWEPGVRWSFTGYAAKPRFTRSLVEDCRLSARADGGTDVSYTMYLDPAPLVKPVFGLAARGIRSSIETALKNLAARA